jgi:hypothetical protein
MEHYHVPQADVQETYLKEHAGSYIAEEFIKFQRREAQLYVKYKEFYGYVFYIGKRMK